MVTAYVVLFIDTTAKSYTRAGDFPCPRVVSAGIFSQPNPTSELLRRFPVSLFSIGADSYEEAEKAVKEALRQPHYEWVRAVMPQMPGLV